jgi:hypothetical protein
MDFKIVDAHKEVINGKLMLEVNKPEEGKQYGQKTGNAPVNFTQSQLSRLADALYNGQQAGLNVQELFNLAPEQMRLEYRFANWQYQGA